MVAARSKTSRDKWRKRRRSLISLTVYSLVAILLAWYFESQATTTVLFVRHADTVQTAGLQDPGLSELGRLRADALADFVGDIDVVAGVDAIYASELRNTRETAAVVADRLGIEVQVADPYEVEPFMARVLREHKGKIVLVVTHADAIAPLVEELHGSKNLPEIAPDEYDNFYIVTIPWYGKVKTLRLYYGKSLPVPGRLHSSAL